MSKDENRLFNISSIDICIKNRIEIIQYLLFYKTKFTVKMKKLKLTSGSYIVDSAFLQNIHRLVLFAQPGYQDTLERFII